MEVRKIFVSALIGAMALVVPASSALAHGGDGGGGGLLGGGLLGGGLLGDGCADGELVTVAGQAGLVGVNLDGLRGLNLNHGLLGEDDGQLLGVGGQNDSDSKNALIVTGQGTFDEGLLGISLGGC